MSVPPPPPPPGSSGAVQLPNWRELPELPSKEAIERQQYANLPDKLLNALSKDKKPFTYTPHGVSGVEKGKLDLREIKSPRMKKRLMANLGDDEERPRSETPDIAKHQVPLRRAITPDVISYTPFNNELKQRTQQKHVPYPTQAMHVPYPTQPPPRPTESTHVPRPTHTWSSPSLPFESSIDDQLQNLSDSVKKNENAILQQVLDDGLQAEIDKFEKIFEQKSSESGKYRTPLSPLSSLPNFRSVSFSPQKESTNCSPTPWRVPPSQQPQEPNPPKYAGAAIPSRSFRILQMMTGVTPEDPDDYGTDF